MTLNLTPTTRGTDLTNRVFGHLTAIRRDGSSPKRGAIWLCRCRCGNETRIPACDLMHEDRKSCGCTRTGSPWPERDGELRALWAEGLSSAEIGRRMEISKNSVVGRAHRLEMEARPSPIKRDGTPIAPKAPRTPKVTLPKMASEVSVRSAPIVRVPFIPRLVSNRDSCCYPFGEPRTPEFRFCEAETASGRPYCPQHVRVCYVPYAAETNRSRMGAGE